MRFQILCQKHLVSRWLELCLAVPMFICSSSKYSNAAKWYSFLNSGRANQLTNQEHTLTKAAATLCTSLSRSHTASLTEANPLRVPIYLSRLLTPAVTSLAHLSIKPSPLFSAWFPHVHTRAIHKYSSLKSCFYSKLFTSMVSTYIIVKMTLSISFNQLL